MTDGTATDTTATTTSDTTTGTTTDATTTTGATDATTDSDTTGDGTSVAASDDATALGSAATNDGTGDDKSGKTEDGKDGKGDEGKADAPPETYELKPFKVGEGDDAAEVQIDTALLETITPTLKEAGLTQAQLDTLAPKVVPAIQEQVLKAQADEFATTRAQWAKEAREDTEIGGKNWKPSLALAAKALDHFGAPSEKNDKGEETNPFRVLLNQSGLGEHRVMVKMFAKIGAAISEDGTFARSEGPTVKKSREEVLYPDDVPKK